MLQLKFNLHQFVPHEKSIISSRSNYDLRNYEVTKLLEKLLSEKKELFPDDKTKSLDNVSTELAAITSTSSSSDDEPDFISYNIYNLNYDLVSCDL